MNKLWHNLAGWLIILVGAIWILGNIYANIINQLYNIGPPNIGEIFVGGVLGSIGIAILFLTPGIYYLRIKERNRNKLTNSFAILNIIGVLLIIIAFIFGFLTSGNPDKYTIAVIMSFLFGVIPAAILYVTSIILLILDWFRKR
jgi:hypothetical protein